MPDQAAESPTRARTALLTLTWGATLLAIPLAYGALRPLIAATPL